MSKQSNEDNKKRLQNRNRDRTESYMIRKKVKKDNMQEIRIGIFLKRTNAN